MGFEIVQVQAVVGYVIKIADQLPLGENGKLCEGRICFDEMTDRVAVVVRMICCIASRRLFCWCASSASRDHALCVRSSSVSRPSELEFSSILFTGPS
jgi:hypothetical protein